MAKLTVNTGTPSDEVVRAAVAEHSVQDATGRTLLLRKPGILAQYRLIEALGDSAKNEAYMGMVMPLLFVGAINGDAVPPLRTKSEVEALIQRLDDAGVEAVMLGVQAHFARQDPEADREALKK
ncbi:hypothetical protein [Pandoraea sp. 64-18]|uniref:hypothetical protein n=1 Tax=Pandoraea sp. 64-18 TaxID=1895806 RepID=UPI0009692F18|nr:hypothetical protein [Pandoraea sp. 64-18]OJY23539.1 MAG: hypothetical protein BGP02_04520 [Pandoraea sp. 64-18]